MHLARRCYVLSLAVFATCLACQPAASEEPATPAAVKAAIRERAKGYLKAIETGDSEEIASFWTEQGDYIDDEGQVINGRRLARQVASRPQREAEARELNADLESLRLASPDVAIEDGVLRVKHGSAEATVVKRFTAIWVRQGDVWLLDAVRELAHPATSPKNPLHGLAWMVGDWRSERGEKTIQLSCRWSDDKHFLLLEIDVNPSQRDSLHVTQRIGWDAREKQIKSWMFDSTGGHGDALWFPQDDAWIVEAARVLADGGRATSTNVYSIEGVDAFVWEVTNFEINGEPQPDVSLRMVRQKDGTPESE